ncbi:hypothetical protein PO878_10885 [Iamia majanohamensis]|uniref:Uncharacterized protein n=1 Tax=Iamia majanohamensis TaxID=467976 RepID=A0AAF0BTN2_9ACTN|nr:hypothetical protein [Iamia majanohamensis]WCO65003.1 hypothetical protein PO878_10885 [Iamia majanohamensis]
MELPIPTPDDPRARLGHHLATHQAGAALAMSTAQRARAAEEGTDLGRALATFLDELEDERDTLRRAQRALDLEPAGVVGVVRTATDGARRLLHLATTARRTPLTRVLELEVLVTGVTGKMRVWEVLGELADQEPDLPDVDWEALVVRARGQREVLLAHHRQAAREAFAIAAPSAADDPG